MSWDPLKRENRLNPLRIIYPAPNRIVEVVRKIWTPIVGIHD